MVFNADQVEGFTLPIRQGIGTAETIETTEEFILNTKAIIKKGGVEAYYLREEDYIALPDISLFHDTKTSTATEAYYSVTFHELTHWTGAERRLDRWNSKRHGKENYAFEELVAELGAAMLCAVLGITSNTRADHAQYINIWLKALKSDKKFIFSAASQAQKASDYLFSLQPEKED